MNFEDIKKVLPQYVVDTDRPWGGFEQFTLNESSTVKILTVKPGEAFSLQYHDKREEFWVIIEGSGTVHVGDKDYDAHVGDHFDIPIKTNHRMTGGPNGIKALEIVHGDTFDESDIVRLEDKYGRK